uniref:Uncharacterized protein n=1 Tax=Arundo donax TaxID=35708 RepID=A0A0A9HJZ5_ARUDO
MHVALLKKLISHDQELTDQNRPSMAGVVMTGKKEPHLSQLVLISAVFTCICVVT